MKEKDVDKARVTQVAVRLVTKPQNLNFYPTSERKARA